MRENPSDVPGSSTEPATVLDTGKDQPQALLDLQRELIETYDQLSRRWLERVKSEVDLWSALAAKLAATSSVPEAIQAYQESVAQSVRLVAEDGRRLAEGGQKIVSTIARTLPDGKAVASG
jgi:hypothetical protein